MEKFVKESNSKVKNLLRRKVVVSIFSILSDSFPLFTSISSSSSCRAASTDIPDHLSPLLPIIHRLRQVHIYIYI